MATINGLVTMTTKQADKAIKSGEQITMFSPRWNETIVGRIVSRDRWSIRVDTGDVRGHIAVFSRDETVLIQN